MAFLRSASTMLAGRVVGAGLAFGISVLGARVIPPEQFGAVVAAVAAVALLVRMASLGAGQAAQFWGAAEGRLGGNALALCALSAIGPTLLLAGLIWFWPDVVGRLLVGDDGAARTAFNALKYGAPLSMLHFVLSTYLLGRKQVVIYQAVTIVPVMATALILIWAALTGAGYETVIAAYQAQYVLAMITGLVVAVALGRGSTLSRQSAIDFGRYAAASYPVFILSFAVGHVSILLGARLAGTSELADFAVSRTLSESIMVVYGAIGPLVLSYVGAMESGAESQAFIGRVARLSTALFVLMAAGLALAAPIALPLLFGHRYADAHVVLWALLPGVAFSGMQKVLENYVYGRARPASLIWVHAAALAALFATAFALAPRLGAVGVAAAASASFLVGYLATLLIVWRQEGVAPWRLLLPTPSDVRLVLRRVTGARR